MCHQEVTCTRQQLDESRAGARAQGKLGAGLIQCWLQVFQVSGNLQQAEEAGWEGQQPLCTHIT